MMSSHPHFTELLGREVTRLKRTTAALLLATSAVTLMSADTWRRRQDLGRALADLAACERACVDEVVATAPAAAIAPARTFDAPLQVDAILDVPLEVLCPSGDIRDTTLRRASAAPAVHLINLWQIGCTGCRREFPELARALAAAPSVRFLAVDAEDIRAAADAYKEAQLRHGMPTPTASLIDRAITRRSLRDALQRLAAASPIDHRVGLVYPLTFVLDCQGQMRWWKVGAIHADEVGPLGDLLNTLSEGPSCRADAPTPKLCNRPPPPHTHPTHTPSQRATKTKTDTNTSPNPEASSNTSTSPNPETTPNPDASPIPLEVPLPVNVPPVLKRHTGASNPTPTAPVPPAPERHPTRDECRARCAEPLVCQPVGGGFLCAAPPPPL